MKNLIPFLIIASSILFISACSDDEPSKPIVRPVIETGRFNMGFNDEITLTLSVDGNPATGYEYNWNCEFGEIVSGQNTHEIKWKSPEYIGNGAISVSVSGSNVESPEDLILTTVAPFYDDFKGNDNHWYSNYVNKWIGDDQRLHFKGSANGANSLLYAKVNSGTMDYYRFSSRFAPVSSEYMYFEYGVYIKTRDTAEVRASDGSATRILDFYSFALIFTNVYTDVNFYTMGYTEINGERGWVLIDAGMYGMNEEVTIEYNKYIDLEWIMYVDKSIEVKANGVSIGFTNILKGAEARANRVMDFTPSLVGFRTVHTTEVAVEEIKVDQTGLEMLPQNSASFNPDQPVRIMTLDKIECNSPLLNLLRDGATDF